jgi:hypothetical protein
MFDNLNMNDGIFIVMASFFISICLSPFLNLPTDGTYLIYYMFEVFIITLVVTLGLYSYLKSRSNEATYLTQEKIMKTLFIIFIVLAVFFMVSDVYAQRKTRHGFAWFMITICIILIAVFGFMVNSKMSERMGLNNTNFLTPFDMRLYSAKGDYY